MKFSELVRILRKSGFRYSLIIEATGEPDYFGFYSPDLVGFSGIGSSVEDCLYKAKWGMEGHIALLKGMEGHIALLKGQGLSIPIRNPNPSIISSRVSVEYR
ncbi:MAG: hypothetical protein B6I19_11285 [Bacteroidetes bacterium 4572_114]|nr:MAG: hypothetical protein B6I19_11285 [Bacteroidetes bacterium 4572_114]